MKIDLKETYNTMADSPVGSLLASYCFLGLLDKDKAMKKFNKAKNDDKFEYPQTPEEVIKKWCAYFKLPTLKAIEECYDIYLFANDKTFRFAPGIKNDEGEVGFYPLQDNGKYTYFERVYINPNNRVNATVKNEEYKWKEEKKNEKENKISD